MEELKAALSVETDERKRAKLEKKMSKLAKFMSKNGDSEEYAKEGKSKRKKETGI
ncbi:uncharacterized protein NEPG_00862 [Nematocida parisii ERTm1]|uniref:uncharacterized protein n=1 Tax=Nematocida parisii (strain ERTm1 / ATCC PRA-289) TaxID=881290 RepID=UPI000264B934|nr:uncharacterized protein NEPG_00862 [Nematocida parisii ERTm1]EIJ94195.1 hypothetical protein NEPG_00862 [Nematocida parisii ERTm1]|eukprot:XP_013058691.1 hypothetical protein NEPG_00862 [Nematocida parisii ERTm1]